MKFIVVFSLFLSSFTFACPDFTHVYACRSGLNRLDRLKIEKTPTGYQITKDVTGLHENENGQVEDGPYTRTYDVVLGDTENSARDENGQVVGVVRTHVTCESNELRVKNEAHLTEPIWDMESWEAFTLDPEGRLSYSNSLLSEPASCEFLP